MAARHSANSSNSSSHLLANNSSKLALAMELVFNLSIPAILDSNNSSSSSHNRRDILCSSKCNHNPRDMHRSNHYKHKLQAILANSHCSRNLLASLDSSKDFNLRLQDTQDSMAATRLRLLSSTNNSNKLLNSSSRFSQSNNRPHLRRLPSSLNLPG